VAGAALAENVDPLDDASQYAWAENAGWIDAEPSGDGGPGVEVGDFELLGWMWAENAGWINLSCKNLSSCQTVDYGVKNDGSGNLSGFAWAENAGWIDFAPLAAGVVIDAVTGEFSGRAWGENVGWITFGPAAYGIRTSWTCDPPPLPPSGSPLVSADKAGSDLLLAWAGPAGATGFDVVRGDLGTLRSSGGNFSLATQECVSGHHTTTSLPVSDVPASGDGFWLLIRGVNCGGSGSYDSAPRDAGILACP
jgi:hypothetical protein